MARFLLLPLLLCVCFSAQAQYSEPFSVPNKGYLINNIDDFTTVNWSLSPWNVANRDAADYFSTTAGGVLECLDLDEQVYWESPLINTTAAPTVSIKMDLTWKQFDSDVAANNCSTDWIKVEYSVNGGAYIMIPNVVGGNACATVAYPFVNPGQQYDGMVSINHLGVAGGSTLKIRVRVFTNVNAEVVTIDNVAVPEAGVTVGCAAPVLSTVVTPVGCSNPNSGAIDLTVSAGTPPYTYSWTGGATTQDRSGLPTGTYTVTVTDAASCSATISATIGNAPTLTLTTQVQDASCGGNMDGEIALAVSGGVPGYTYSWTGGATTKDLVGVGTGTYTVTVTDASGCTATKSAVVGVLPMTAYNEQFNIANKGYLLNQVNDFAGVNWTLSPWTFDEPPAGIGRDNGDSFVTTGGALVATDLDEEVCWESPTIDVTGATQFSEFLTWTGFDPEDYITVYYSFNGAAYVAVPNLVGGGAGTIQYNTLDNSNSGTAITPIAPGTTTLKIKICGYVNTNNENFSIDNVTAPGSKPYCPAPVPTLTKTNVTCNGASNGTITTTVTNGSTPYTYAWSDGGVTTQNRTGLAPGTYTVTVTDANMLTGTASTVITEPALIVLTETHVNVLCNGASTGSIDLTVTGGITPYTYSWTGGATTQDRSGLAAGTYTVTVTDANACTKTLSVTITEPADGITLTETHVNVLCSGNSTGSIDLTVTGGVSPYTYSWTGGATTQDRSGLAAGTYTVTVTDANACTKTLSVTITQPTAIVLTETHVNVLCNGNSTGSIDLTVTGGVTPYTYSWTGGVTTQDRSGLAAGTYTVTVTDANACTKTLSVTITEPTNLVLTETHVNVLCNGASTGSIDLTVSGGVSPYTYSWTGGATTQDRSGLVAGTYTVTVTDANACTKTLSVAITEPADGITLTETHVNVLCSGNSTGSIDLTVTGGVSPYTYSWTGGATTQDRLNLAAGTYTVTVTDANACTKTLSVTITEPTALVLTETHVNVLCNGNSTGSIDLTVTGGVTPYTYSWTGGATTQDRSGLAAGTYTVTVTDVNACTKTLSVTITEPTNLVLTETHVNVLCNGASTGSIDLTVSGGVSPYTYSWTGGATTQDRSGLAAGTYTVTVTDANACTKTLSATITEATAIVLTETHVNVLCNGSSTGSIDLTVSGGVTPYTYSWTGGATTQDRSGLAAGTYTVTVTDANACTKTLSVTITQPTAIVLTETHVDVLCNGNSTGSIDLTVSGGVAAYTYSWTGGVTTQDRSGLSAGTYTVTVTDANACTKTLSVTITEPPLLTLSTTQVNVLCNGASTGSIDLTPTGGVTPYTYAWTNSATTQDLSGIAAGTYTVTTTDANGCTKTISATITQPTAIVLSTTTTPACAGVNNGTIDLTVSGGITPYTYSWTGGATTQDLANLGMGTYTVTVTDANGCTKTTSATILQSPIINLSTTSINTCTGTSVGSIDLTVTGGTPGFTYIWTPGGATTQDIANLAAGTYTVTVTDANTCTKTISQTVTANPVPTVNAVANQTLCAGSSTTAVTFSGTPAGVVFNWTNNTPSIGLAANGTGNIASFVAVNNTLVPVVATITVTPQITAGGTTCLGTAIIFTITVNPLPAQFAVTGGGLVCTTDNIGVPVGLSGSQSGVNYQLFLNGNPVGAPVAGTGNAITFGTQLPAGTYTVIATATLGGCTRTMTGTVSVATFNCTVAISDPCVCLNNASTLFDGQFGEKIKVNAPSTQIWTVTAINGLYSNSSPLPPSAPIPLPIGTVLMNIGGNMFTLDGRHVDALGYTITVSNGLGTFLSIGNSCEYPNPSITADLNGPFCLFSNPVNLTGNPGDANIISQGFTVNGVPATVFDPGQGVGQYTIVYTVNGGLPKAFGPNDPGCIQSVSTIVNVVATPTNVICNDHVYVSLDADCTEALNPDAVLEGTYGCYDDYILEIDKTIPYGNGPWVPGVVVAGDIGKTYQVRITHLVSGNKCWGLLTVEDKLAPALTCVNFDIPCNTPNLSPNYLQNVLGIAFAFPAYTDCQNVILTFTDTELDSDCASGFSKIITRKWTAVDASGNSATCDQIINLLRPDVDDLTLPPSYDGFQEPGFNCTSEYPTPDWIESQGLQGYPWVFGRPEGCNINWAYTDILIEVCDGTYKIVRSWTLLNWCLGQVIHYDQVIKVADSATPEFVCPANLTVSVDPFTCCSTTNLPDVIVTDNCSRINNIGGMVVVREQFTGNIINMVPIGGILQDFPGNNWWNRDTLAAFGFTPCLPAGIHDVTYIVEDDCGNKGSCTFSLTVRDYVPPVASCDETTTVAIGGDDLNDCYTTADGCDFAGVTWVKATTFDDGSYDNCNNVKFTIRRMEPYSDCINQLNTDPCYLDAFGDLVFGEQDIAKMELDSLKFYCCEVGTIQTVILRVYQIDVNGAFMPDPDGDPLYNECMIQVEVQDKLKPACLPPAPVTVNCENFDPSLWAYGKAQVADNCCLDTSKVYQGQCGLTHTVAYNNFDTVCNKGTITRTFRAFDCHGFSSQCTQRVVVTYEQDYFVKFPNDVIVTVCDGTGIYGEPTFFGEDCELLGVSFEDEVFTVVPDACFKIERSWSIINWCTYNPNLPCINVPNPNPNPQVNNPANLAGPTVSQCGTLPPWAPTSVRINPTDPQPTNFCTFWQKDANCYQYKQIIKIVDGQAPTGTYVVPDCSNQNWLTPNNTQLWNEAYWWHNGLQTHDLCEEPTDLCITGTDACSGSNVNIEYLLFLDLDGDGVMETVVNSASTGIAGLGWNNVLYNNLNTPNFAGGTLRNFDERPVPGNQKWGFSIQETITGNNKTACVRWNTQQQQNTHVVPELPHGTHKIKWFITDGCGNNAEYEYTFTVKDCKAPTVVCINGLSTNIMPTGMITLWASDFLQYTEDNCTPSGQLKIGIRKCGTGTGFPVDGNGNPITNVTFNCTELGTQCVELWSIDAAGNADYCETYVIVQDNQGNCPNNGQLMVSGALKTELGEGVEEAVVNLSGAMLDLTDANGFYQFSVPPASTFTIAPEKDDNPLNGVTTYDLVLISKHILGLEPLNTPYKMIAADANKSGSITTFDIVEIRKLVLGIYTELPNNTSWRFVDKAYSFPTPSNPFQTVFPESISMVDIMTNQMSQDFVGVKIGDVNNTSVANATMQAEERTQGTALFDLEDRDVKAGEAFEVTFNAAQPLKGFQFTMLLNGLKVVEVVESDKVTAANFGLVFKDAATLSIDGAQAFTLRFRADKSGKLSEMLGVSGSITKAEAYPSFAPARQDSAGGEATAGKNDPMTPNNAITRLGVAFRFGGKTISGIGFELYQNQPNPFVNKTSIGFYLPEAAEATLTILDETGRAVYQQKGQFAKGENSIALDRALLNTTGALYYKLETATDRATKKMIQAK